ncbi:hypothetical protein AX16_009654 [Volvariella volvacea WC 439]|nr:hypothetical protein AX16_009654 [Volvariella volvacea WC 439]
MVSGRMSIIPPDARPKQQAGQPKSTGAELASTLSAAWKGGLRNAEQYAGDPDIRAAINRAMSFWFFNDFPSPACLDQGGTDACPCTVRGLWNKNWYSNVILIPKWVGQTCLLLGDSLSTSEREGCDRMTQRTYATFVTGINGVSVITGANTQDIASIGIDNGLFNSNETLVADGYNRVHNELVIKDGIRVDGIRPDGSFGQHSGILYNGNYGKDYANDIFNLEIAAGTTRFEAGDRSKAAFTTLFQGNQWMIFLNTVTGVLHWDYSVVGRMISLPVVDNQSTANLKMDLTQLQLLGTQWNSTGLLEVYSNLISPSSTANAGSLFGNKMFFTNDYMVHRGNGYVTTLKMFSKRTQNTECTNGQNNLGFHLSDGVVYTYLRGDEYEDTFAAWDWNLIPGITVDYGATPLSCSTARKTGNQAFVGGASDGRTGVAAMHYDNPATRALTWRKTWFFLDDAVQFVMIASVTSSTSAPVLSVLDQKRRNGDILVNGESVSSGDYTGVSTLWHDGVGYVFKASDTTTSLSIQTGVKSGSWSSIGSSKQPPTQVDMFTAWLNHHNLTSAINYAIYPATTPSTFQAKIDNSNFQSIRNDGSISALLDTKHSTVMLVFWNDSGGTAVIPSTNGTAPLTMKSSGPACVILKLDTWTITVADPTQSVQLLTFTLSLGSGDIPTGWPGGSWRSVAVEVILPKDGLAGGSVTGRLHT